MTEYYNDKLITAYDLHIMNDWNYKQVAEYYGFGKAASDHIRAMFNRFVKIGASLQDVRDYLDGNYLVSAKALEYYIRFVGGTDRQISAERLAQELGVYDVERLKCMLFGMTATQHDLLNYTDTNGMDCLSIR